MIHKRRAVSDVLAAVMLIAVVIVGFAGIVYPLILRYQSSAQAALRSGQQEALQAEVLITPVYSYTEQRNGTTYFYVYLYNYGKVGFRPSEFIVSAVDAGTYEVTSFALANAQNGQPVSSIQPGQIVEVEFSVQYSNAVPSEYNITAVGNGISLTWSV